MMDSRTQARSRWVDQRRVEQAAVGLPTRGAAEGGPGVVSAGEEENCHFFNRKGCVCPWFKYYILYG